MPRHSGERTWRHLFVNFCDLRQPRPLRLVHSVLLDIALTVLFGLSFLKTQTIRSPRTVREPSTCFFVSDRLQHFSFQESTDFDD
jgi:hypothetical protein